MIIITDNKTETINTLAIISSLIDINDSGASIQKLFNTRFSDLPTELKPIIKTKNGKHELAFWCKDKKVFDLTRDLLNLDGKSGGYWSDATGNKSILINKE